MLTVGNYDGVHLGHQKMIGVLKQRAAELRSTATVLVFEPSSKEFIDPEGAPPRLTRWREKYLALAAQGVDRLVTLRFDETMRAMTPERFVELIVEGLGARHIVVGNDFRYGCNAGGTIESLRAAGEARGFGVEQIAPFVFDGVRVSSTAVRERLGPKRFRRGGAPAGASLSDAWPSGAWQRIGPHLGVSDGESAAHAAQAAGQRRHGGACFWSLRRTPLTAVASLGTRPTVDGTKMLLEVHVFDFAADLYGREIEVEFVAKLRDEVKFDSLEALIVQMKVDAAQARDVLSKVSCD